MAIGREGNVKWVDGIRGFASILVVLTHIARSFDGELFLPASGENASPRLFQLPFLRVLVQGRLGVAIFAFVTGYVCALKPIKLFQQCNHEAAFTSMGKSALRRVPRLVLPAALATTLIWLLSELGAFQVAKRCDSWWIGATSPDQTPRSLVASVKDLFANILLTWTLGMNHYDGNQWTMLPLLKGSLWVYMFMMGTGYVQQRYRMLLSMAVYLYFYVASDAVLGMQFFWGVFIADLQNNEAMATFLLERRRLCRILSTVLIFLGLFLASYPEDKFEWMTWSRVQHDMLVPVLPAFPDIPHFASGLGLELITLGLHFSPRMRDLLSSRYLIWFGKQSFAVYLLHGPLLRTVLCWMVFGFRLPADIQNEEGNWVEGPPLPFPGMRWLFFCLMFWIPLNYGVAVLWTTYVDPWCAQITERFVGYVKMDKDEKPTMLPQ